MIETAMVFDDHGNVIHWHEPPGRSCGWIPDTRSLWDVLWENRRIVEGVAHTHPWEGEAQPSETDLTTFAAIEAGLGRRLIWPIVTFTQIRCCAYNEMLGMYEVVGWPKSDRWLENINELRRKSRNGG